MMKRFLQYILLVLLTATFVQPVLADGWPQRKGHGYFKLSFRWVKATSYYEPSGNRIDIPTLNTYTGSFYGEYGLTNRLTAVAYIPFIERLTLNKQVGRDSGVEFFAGDAATHIADPIIGIRYGLITGGPTVVSLGVRLGIPLGDSTQESALYTGDGEFNQQIALEVGHSFYPRPMYMVGSVGFNNRTEGFSDEVSFSLEGGYTFAQKLTVLARMRGLVSLENGDTDIIGGRGGLAGNNQRYLALAVEAIYSPNGQYGIALNVEGATWAENVLAAPAFTVGIFTTL